MIAPFGRSPKVDGRRGLACSSMNERPRRPSEDVDLASTPPAARVGGQPAAVFESSCAGKLLVAQIDVRRRAAFPFMSGRERMTAALTGRDSRSGTGPAPSRKSSTFRTDGLRNHAVPHGDWSRNAPSGIRTRATTLKGWRPGPLVDGGGPSEDTRGRRYHPWPPGRLAQLVERLPYTQVAAGSSPAPPTDGCRDCGSSHSTVIRLVQFRRPDCAVRQSVGTIPGGSSPTQGGDDRRTRRP